MNILNTTKSYASIEATIIRADGTVEHLGEISRQSLTQQIAQKLTTLLKLN